VFENRRTAVKGCVASSKTKAAALVVHAFLQAAAPAKVFSTAPSSRQVDGVLWGEVRSIKAQANFPIGGELKPVASEWQIGPDWFALGFSSNDPNRFHGWHGQNLLFIIDEVQGVDEGTIHAIENTMADGQAKLLILENPSALTGLAHEAFHSQRHLWNCISIAAQDTPNYKARKIVVPGMITYDQAQEWKEIYGVDSDFYRVKVLAEFPKQEPDTVIPLDWIEKAWARTPNLHGPIDIGVDVARFGNDDTVIQPIIGSHCPKPHVIHGQDTMAVSGYAVAQRKQLRARVINVDSIGVGAGVVDRLDELGEPVNAINVAEAPKDKERYADCRSELFFEGLRNALDPRNPDAISMEKDDKLAAELIGVKYKIDSAGRIRIESKDDTKKRLGRSPDRADALNLALAARTAKFTPSAAMGFGGQVVSSDGIVNDDEPKADWMGGQS